MKVPPSGNVHPCAFGLALFFLLLSPHFLYLYEIFSYSSSLPLSQFTQILFKSLILHIKFRNSTGDFSFFTIISLNFILFLFPNHPLSLSKMLTSIVRIVGCRERKSALSLYFYISKSPSSKETLFSSNFRYEEEENCLTLQSSIST